MEITEKELKRKVEQYIERDDRIRTGQVQVDVTGNAIKLEGSVPNYNALRAAENDAWMVIGVKSVNNYLTVEPPETSTKPDDLEIEAAIKNVFLWDNRLDSTDTEISVDKGHVEINGTVFSLWEKQIAEEIAYSVTGVVQVTNNLVVNKRSEINDELIADKIFEALDNNPYVNVSDINVTVNEGMVTLSGTVQSYLAANEAHDSLLYIAGVRGIVNNVNIG